MLDFAFFLLDLWRVEIKCVFNAGDIYKAIVCHIKLIV